MTEILLKRELEPLAKQRQRFKLLIALAISWGIVAVVALLVFAVSRFLFPLAPAILLGGIGLVAIVAAFFAARRVNRLAPDYRDIARKIETTKPDLHTLLLTAVEQERDDKTGRLGYLQERLIGDALGAIRQEQNLNAVPRRQMFWAGTAHALALMVLLAVLFTVPRPAPATTSIAVGRAKNQVTVTPGDANVERGSSLVVLARFDGSVPAEAMLIVTTNGGTAKRIPLSKNLNDPVFGASIPDVQGPLSYRIEYSDEHTADFKVTVFEHPRLERADAQITYPTYTELPQKRIEDTKRVSAVEGSTVELSLQLNKPVTTAQLIAKDKSVLPLTTETNKAQARLDAFQLDKSQSYELQLVDAEGRSNKLATTFVFEALTNQRPTLKFVMPRGDQRVSPLQEVFFQAEAQDDFGLKQFGLTYSIGGTEPKALALGSNAPARFKTNFTHMLRLEDIHAEVDQLVTYFVWADDIGPDGKLRRTSSDMYFAEVRPFEQIFREGENMESQNQQQQRQRQQGQQQSESEKLAELQKQIINATWKLQRQESVTKPSERYFENEPVVLESQQQALEQAEAMDEQLQDFQMKEALQVATKHMEAAIEQLTEATNSPAPLPKALAAEQAAYQALLKLQAREFQVMRSQQAQSGQQRSQQRNQAQLDQLDLKQQQNRYETQREASAAPEQDAAKKEQLEQLSKLKELAQRQGDINEKLKELQTALQEAKTEQEKEDLRRELKRLREEQREMLADMDELKQRMEQQKGDQQSREGQQQLEQARQEAQKASEAMEQGSVPQALAAGTRAERDLEKMRDEARKRNSSQFSDEMKQMRNDARELAEKQEEISKKLDEAVEQPKALSDSGQTEELAKNLAEQKQGVTNLLNQMKRVTEQSENAEPLLSKQLYDSLRKNSQGNLDQALAAAEELSRRNFLREAQPFEQRANKEIQNLKQDVERAAESVLGDETEALRAAKRELDALTDQLQRELARAMATNGIGSNAVAAAGRGTQTNRAARGSSTNAIAGAGNQTNAPGLARSGTNGPAGSGQGTNASQLASAQGQNSQSQQQGQQGQQGQGQQGQQAQPGQQGQQQAQQGQQGQGQGQQAQQAQQGQQGQQGQGQQGQQAQNGQQVQQGQGQQQAQQGQRGQGQGQGQGQPTDQQANAQNPGEAQQPSDQQNDNPQRGQRGNRPNQLANLFNQAGAGPRDASRTDSESSPLTGDEYSVWSQRLSNVEEMVDRPELRNRVAQARDRARAARTEFKRHAKPPQWDLVNADILKPLLEVRERIADELSRRESNDSLAPIDRDPVPNKYSDLVKRYYEKLGNGQ